MSAEEDNIQLPPVPGSWGEFIDRCNLKGNVKEENSMSYRPVWFVILYMLLFILFIILLWIMADSCANHDGPEQSYLFVVTCVVVISILLSIGIGFLSGTPSIRPTYAYVNWTAWLSLVILLACVICFAWISLKFMDDSDAYFDAKLEMILQGGEMAVEG